MRSFARRTRLLCSVLLVAGSPLTAQSNWDRYRPGTIAALIQLHDSTIRATPSNMLPTWIMPGEQFPTRARLIYRGDSRPVDSIRLEIVRRWGKSFLRDTSIAAPYRREYLFQEDQQLFWLPVQDKVASFFPRELHAGQPVTLYVLWLGAYYAGGEITWALVVTEFNADTTAR